MEEKRQAKNVSFNREFCVWASKALKTGCAWRIKTDFEQHILSVIEHCEDLPFAITEEKTMSTKMEHLGNTIL